MPKVHLEQLRSVSSSLTRFLEFEAEVEQSIRQEESFRKEEYEEQKRAREKKARKKRLKKLRQLQQQ
jgi:hypothetical protein